MLRLRALLPCAPLRVAAVLLCAGITLSASDKLFWPNHAGEKAGFTRAIIAAAVAEDRDDSRLPASRSNSSGGNNGESTPASDTRGHGGNSGTGSGTPHAQPHSGDSHPAGETLTYDAGKNMLRLHLHLGGAEHGATPHSLLQAHHPQEGPAWHVGHGHSSDQDKKALTDVYLRNITEDGWREGHSVEALGKAVDPVEARYRHFAFTPSSPTTVVPKTKFAIDGLSFSPSEILAVGVDPESVERAQALGFKADPEAGTSQPGERIMRFTVPPGVDAVRARELLSRELPGHRFELNRIYRLYRAAMRDEPATKEKSQPAPEDGSKCPAERCFAKSVIGWKDTLAPCARGLKVGVIDTDIDESHPAFAGRHIHRDDFSPDGRTPAPDWHGTGVVALLAGSPFAATPGLIPDAEFFVANVFFADERGEMAADTLSLLKALNWMKAYNVKLINMSFSGPRDGLVAEAIQRMSESGVVFVAAAGNEGPTAEPSYPAAYPQVVAVTAVTKELRNYRYANRGDHIDVAAPGVDIWTAVPGAREGYHSGTSFAAPYVTAVLAVEPREILQQGKAALLDNVSVIDLGEQGRDPIYGRGLLLAPQTCTPPSDTIASAAQ